MARKKLSEISIDDLLVRCGRSLARVRASETKRGRTYFAALKEEVTRRSNLASNGVMNGMVWHIILAVADEYESKLKKEREKRGASGENC